MVDKEYIVEWVRFASNDLFTAKHMFEDVYPKQIEISAFHCQQCAEKILKAFLVAHDIEPPRTHNLMQLCEMCQDFDAEYSALYDDCKRLNPFGVEVRYPNELAPDEAIVKTAIERTQKIYDFCMNKLKLDDRT